MRTMPGAPGQGDSTDVDRLRPYVERARRFRGWNLKGIAPKRIGPGPPWDYEGRARELLARATRALDIGTGAGNSSRDCATDTADVPLRRSRGT